MTRLMHFQSSTLSLTRAILWKKMVSFAFLLCSTLLLSGAIAAPYPGETDDSTAVSAVAADVALATEYVLYNVIPQNAHWLLIF